jgi:hypothetical protein
MEYEVVSTKKVCGKINGERLTEFDIISSGGNVEFLLAAGHIKEAGKTPKIKETFEPKFEEFPEVEEVKFEVSDEINLNYEGDK